MPSKPNFVAEQRLAQSKWFSANLAHYNGYCGADYRVSPEHRLVNLSPAVREAADRLFGADPAIQWHQHANHGLSSQVCCVNFLLPFADKPELLARWITHVTGDKVGEVLPIELDRAGQDWFVTFEWIGDADYLNEASPGAQRKRGANATAADAAILYRTAAGATNLLLVEWKYTERYGQPLDPKGNSTRRARYEAIWRAPNGPIRADIDVDLEDFFWEPFYQMLRQQMLAWHTEQTDVRVDRARVLHLSPAGNRPLHLVTSPTLQRLGDDAFDVFRSLLTDPADFRSMSIEAAFKPLGDWPEADWFAWLQQRYVTLCADEEFA
ncbi:hypothetical protein [Novosphingobium sp.]|uniref:PGN_0703 family putative restriction endonuclease n=1 Tax=Novosphingobium sp. TaxID=1874826 RepID=UPI001D8C55C9|nr:hypothetical protein [Novosphingobium sp.]MBX9664426.1 hypothetical protein [Novosphingobium sp.]